MPGQRKLMMITIPPTTKTKKSVRFYSKNHFFYLSLAPKSCSCLSPFFFQAFSVLFFCFQFDLSRRLTFFCFYTKHARRGHLIFLTFLVQQSGSGSRDLGYLAGSFLRSNTRAGFTIVGSRAAVCM